jgi:flagellar M-ring protein FliF
MATAPLTPKRVSVSITVPSSYFEKVYHQQYPSASDQPIDQKKLDQVQKDATDRIKAQVANLIPQTDLTADARPQVTVETFQQIPADIAPGPGAGSVVLDWILSNWSTAGLTGLALVSLVMLRSMVRSAPLQISVPELPLPPAAAPVPEKEVKKEVTEPTEKRAGRLKRRLGSGQSLRDELAEMVREDPDTAASILRGWIGTTS